MPPRRLSLGADNRYIIQTIAYSSQYSCPIPSWANESAQTAIPEIDRLKQFCAYDYGYLHDPAQSEHGLVWRRTLAQVLCLIGLAASLSLHPSTSYSQAGLDNASTAVSLESAASVPASSSKTASDKALKAGQAYTEPFDLSAPAASSQGMGRILSKPVAEPQNPTISQTQSPILALATASKVSKLAKVEQSGEQFSLPVTGFAMTSSFGNRIHPIFGNIRFHKGIDLGTPTGTPIRAARDGRVVSAGWGKGYGNRIVIDHGNGYETLYAHLDQLLVKVGDRVTNKAIIGLSGSTGYVTGPHLHFEIRFNQVAQNPLDYFREYKDYLK